MSGAEARPRKRPHSIGGSPRPAYSTACRQEVRKAEAKWREAMIRYLRERVEARNA